MHKSKTHTQTFETVRGQLFGIAYRMLGSASDAEDVLQDAWLRWSRVPLDTVDSDQAYLASMVTRISIDRLRREKVERLLYTGPWLPEPLDHEMAAGFTDPEATRQQAESISMGFLLLMQNLPPLERAVFILREAFDLSHKQVASMLDIETAHSRQLLRRARTRMEAADNDDTPDVEVTDIMEKFLEAATTGSLENLRALMTDDIIALSDGGGRTSAALIPLIGKDRVGTVLMHLIGNATDAMTMHWTRLNGKPALVIVEDEAIHSTHSIEVKDGLVHRIYTVRNPDKLKFVSVESLV